MEELIEILIRLIARLVENKTTSPTPRPASRMTPPPPPRATTKPVRRQVRRPGQATPVAVAKPIVTSFSSEPVTPMQKITAKPITSPAATVPTQNAAAIRKWLSPQTLKKQFLLTEILQPPLALRGKLNSPVRMQNPE